MGFKLFNVLQGKGNTKVAEKSFNESFSKKKSLREADISCASIGSGSSPPKDNIAIVSDLMALWSDSRLTAKTFAEYYVSGNTKVHFEDGVNIPALQLGFGIERLYKSFPDIKFSWDSIKEQGSNMVVVEGVVVEATHTGEPYSMLPGTFPAIEATGIRCVNDEERFVFELNDGKVKSLWIIALGSQTGVAGLYEQIGGSTVPPTKEA